MILQLLRIADVESARTFLVGTVLRGLMQRHAWGKLQHKCGIVTGADYLNAQELFKRPASHASARLEELQNHIGSLDSEKKGIRHGVA